MDANGMQNVAVKNQICHLWFLVKMSNQYQSIKQFNWRILHNEWSWVSERASERASQIKIKSYQSLNQLKRLVAQSARSSLLNCRCWCDRCHRHRCRHQSKRRYGRRHCHHRHLVLHCKHCASPGPIQKLIVKSAHKERDCHREEKKASALLSILHFMHLCIQHTLKKNKKCEDIKRCTKLCAKKCWKLVVANFGVHWN